MAETTGLDKKAVLVQGVWFEGALLARILMQVVWISLWYNALMGGRVKWPVSGLAIFMALSVSTLLVRLFDLHQNWRPGLRPAIFAVWMILFFLVSLKWLVWPGEEIGLFQTVGKLIHAFVVYPFDFGILWHVLLMPILIWQGVSLGNSRGSLTDTINGFKVGFLLLLLYGLIFMPAINLVNSLPWLAFLCLGLLAVSVNRIADLIPLRGGRLPSSTGTWWAAIAGGSVLLVAISLSAGSVLHNLVRYGVYVGIGLVLLPSALILVGVALLVLLVINWLHPHLSLSIGQFLNAVGNPITAILESDRLMKNLQKAGRHTIDEYLLPAIIALIVLLIVAFIFIDLRSRRSWIRRVLPEENIRDVFDLRRSRRERELSSQKQGWQAGRILAAARIRQIYADLLYLAEKVGSPRSIAQTPLEFLPTLSAVFPNNNADSQLITQAYLKIRYGGFPESANEVKAVEEAWKSIQAQGRILILDKKREEREKSRN